MKGYMLFRKDRPGKHGGGVALYVRQHMYGMYQAVSWGG